HYNRITRQVINISKKLPLYFLDLALILVPLKVFELPYPQKEYFRWHRFARFGLSALRVHVEPVKDLPEIKDEKFLFLLVRQPILVSACRVCSSTSPNHLPESDLGEHWFDEREVADFGNVYSSIKHVHRNSNSRHAFLLELL